jgi:F0F1-type ATP synthase epsilon subunit
MTLQLSILRPFSEEKKQVEWVRVECPGGSFTVGVGHRPLINILAGSRVVTYQESGAEHTLEVSAEGGMVHVTNNQVILFLS